MNLTQGLGLIFIGLSHIAWVYVPTYAGARLVRCWPRAYSSQVVFRRSPCEPCLSSLIQGVERHTQEPNIGSEFPTRVNRCTFGTLEKKFHSPAWDLNFFLGFSVFFFSIHDLTLGFEFEFNPRTLPPWDLENFSKKIFLGIHDLTLGFEFEFIPRTQTSWQIVSSVI